MKISFCSIAFRHRPLWLRDIIFIISEIGYDGIEIWGEHLKGYETALERLRKTLIHCNIEVSMLSPYFDFTGTYKKWWKSIEEGKKFIHFAKELNCSLIRCFTGKVPSEFATEKQFKSAVEGIRYLAKIAKEENITLAIETHPNTLADTVKSTLKLIETINMENVKVNLDFYNLWEIERVDPLVALDQLFDHTVNIHAKNACIQGGRISPFHYVMDKKRRLTQIRYLKDGGDLDYDKIIYKLLEKGYKYYFAVETFETERHPIRVAKDELFYLRNLINKIKTEIS